MILRFLAHLLLFLLVATWTAGTYLLVGILRLTVWPDVNKSAGLDPRNDWLDVWEIFSACFESN